LLLFLEIHIKFPTIRKKEKKTEETKQEDTEEENNE
jgi:hypothetical protein